MNAIILSAVFGVLMMFCSIFVKDKYANKNIAIIGLFILLVSNVLDTYGFGFFSIDTKEMLHFDKFGLFFNTIAIFATFVFVMLSGKEIENIGNHSAEYFALLFFALCGITVLSTYSNLLMLFLGIEIMSIPLYILTGSDKLNLKSNEASLKYFLMGAFSTGLMLMGIALIYGATGSFSLSAIHFVFGSQEGASFLAIMGLLFLLVSMSFKVSAAPFHFWAPDVYDGAPSVITSFMATIVKAAAFIAFIKLFDAQMMQPNTAINWVNWRMLIAIIIISTLLVGNITAIFQQSVKRMLAYSSIAQAGFMMFAIFCVNDVAKEGLLLYSVAYSLATIGIFSILVKMKDYSFEGYNGLAKTQPVLAFANTIFLLSLTGIPLTAGFFAKYFMLAAMVKTGGYTWLVILAVIFAAISAYYYFRVIQSMYFKDGDGNTTEAPTSAFKISLAALACLIILFGIFPQLVLNWFYF
ncbi:MAG: NADH-quinone oxidoreductase subunit N [Chitinophagaceae bacterium]